MWLKSIFGVVLSLLISISLMFNLYYLLPIPLLRFFEIAFILCFIAWASVMTSYYCYPSFIKPAIYSALCLCISGGFNALSYLEVL